jgi:hypothetical protein
MLNTFCILLRFIQLILYDTINLNKVSIYITPFIFLFYSLHVSAPMGHPQVRYAISYFSAFGGLF